jgi:BirA family transcriptional regulator, biotin operon repressor / biotin---[acetyl-CoA-carboxylase] ligase
MEFDLERVRERLPERRVEWFSSVDSTMRIAAQMAREGCAGGSVVGADEQTAGIGRHGHSWHSEPDAGLYVSIVLRVPVEAAGLPVVMLALGLAAQEAIAKSTGLAADLRWPNDVLLDSKKCAGILAQIEGDAVVTGIGINVNHTAFPAEIAELATSLRIAGGAPVSREELLVALLEAVDRCLNVLEQEGPEAILRLFSRSSSYAEGRRVRVEQDGSVIEGVTCGLDRAGFLRVRRDDGKEAKILAGGVRPA